MTKVQVDFHVYWIALKPLQMGKVWLGNNNIVITPGSPQMASWLGRAASVAWEIASLENARSFFDVDEASTFETQQV